MAEAHYPNIGEISGAEKPPVSVTSTEVPLEQRLAVAEAERDQATRLLRDGHQPAPVRRLAPEVKPPPEPGPIPDQATDPEGFTAWHARDREYERWRNDQNTNSVRDAAVQGGRSTEILNAYLTSRPKYQGLRTLVVQCFREVCEELRIDGLPDNTATLDAAVDKRMREVTKAAAAAVDDLPAGSVKNAKGKKDEETPPSRTEGLSAGSKGGSAGGKSEKEGEKKPKGMVDVMLGRQAESPFF
jgi:hypothetical protein